MLRKARRAIESLQAEVEDEKTRQQEARERLGAIEDDRDRALRETSELEAELAAVRAQLAAHGGDASAFAGERDRFAEQLRDAISARERAERALAAEQDAARHARAEAEGARGALEEARRATAGAERALEHQRAAAADLERARGAADARAADLAARVAALEDERAGLLAQADAAVQGAILARRTELAADGLLEQLGPLHSSLAVGLVLSDAASAHAEERDGELARLRAALHDAQARWREAEATSAQLGAVLRAQAEHSRAQDEAAARLDARLRAQEGALAEQLARVRQREALLAARIASQRRALDEAEASARELRAKLDDERAAARVSERLLMQTAREADGAAAGLAASGDGRSHAEARAARAEEAYARGLRDMGRRLAALDAELAARARGGATAATSSADEHATLLGRMRGLVDDLGASVRRAEGAAETAVPRLQMWEATVARAERVVARARAGPVPLGAARAAPAAATAGRAERARRPSGTRLAADRATRACADGGAPPSDSERILGEACAALQLADARELLPLLSRLAATVGQLPQLEACADAFAAAWEAHISAYARSGPGEQQRARAHDGDVSLPPPDELRRALAGWSADVALAQTLTSLRAQLVAALRSRPDAPAPARAAPAAAKAGARAHGAAAQAAPELWGADEIVAAVRELVAFERSISEHLSMRPHLAPGGGAPLVSRGQSVGAWCIDGVHELVGLEQRLLSSARTFSAAQANIAAAPAHFVHRAVALFQRLFDVPELDDLFERIWQVHLLHADAHALHVAVCAALGVPEDTPVSHALKLLQDVAPTAPN
ncbi:hypothetical protein KFE25_008465 [Diacronema lutheri]|uniref:Uncharacterized protein n=1 Tax=Diacronema lutheri TaxID=2081491 RepID=A0A8J5X8M5_DIALT|nr:hypothetical protein KFE25_008465 [Diacronema lutheri]